MEIRDGHGVGIAATRFHRVMKQAVQRALETFGVSGTEYGALLFIEQHPGTSNADLARFLIVTPQALGRLSTSLQGQGLVERPAEQTAGRRRPLSLTPAGRALLQRAAPVVEDAQRTLLGPLTDPERAAFLRALELCTATTDRWDEEPR